VLLCQRGGIDADGRAANGGNWLLPWQHFLEGRQQAVDGSKRLVLTFATQEVVVVGKNLGVLVDEIARRRLEGVRPAPDKYQKSSVADAFVAKIEVRSRADIDADE
jgi:hypothetical protein